MEQEAPQSEVLTYATPVAPINTPADIARRALLWTVMCSVCAVPSFLWGTIEFNKAAMVTGVLFFIVLYAVGTSTPACLRFRQKLFVRRTLYIGYGTRLVISIIFPLGMIVDFIPGLISIGIGEGLLGHPNSFAGTLLITMLQGTFVNILLSIYMVVVWGIQRMFLKIPEERRGFPVELTSSPGNDSTQ